MNCKFRQLFYRNMGIQKTCRIYSLLLAALFLFSLSCRRNPLDVPIQGIEVQVEIKRLEKDIFESELSGLDSIIPELQARYDEFLDLFSEQIIRIGNPGSPAYAEYLKIFATDYLNYQVYNRCVDEFEDITWLEEDFSRSFRYYKYYFPRDSLPEVISFVSRFNESVIATPRYIGIGLDMYLGEDTEYYGQLGLQTYKQRKMKPEMILPDALYHWGQVLIPYDNSKDDLLSNMIHEGKLMYFIKALMPGAPDSLIFGFTASRMEFCRNNEKQMWTYLVDEKQLFLTDRMVKVRYLGTGPYTRDFTRASPARAAAWIGTRIIQSWANSPGAPSLGEILENTDYYGILRLSRYDP